MAELLLRKDFKRRSKSNREMYVNIYSQGLISFSHFAAEQMDLHAGDRLAVHPSKLGFIKSDEEAAFQVCHSNNRLVLHGKPLAVALVKTVKYGDDPMITEEDALLSMPIELEVLKRPNGFWRLRMPQPDK